MQYPHAVPFWRHEMPYSLLKTPKTYSKGILEKLDKLNKSNPLTYMINGSKNEKSKFWCMLWVLSERVQDTPLQQFLWSNLYLFDSLFVTFHSSGCKEKQNASSVTRIVQIRTTTKKIELTG